jgi:S-disulfanyl-L-cysteine oxidoreductase SoxD
MRVRIGADMRQMGRKTALLGIVAIFTQVAWLPAAQALPFNDDMVNNQPKTGQVMRPLPEGSIARGSLDSRVENHEQAEKLENPLRGDALSTKSGKRLYTVNCMPCHGDIAADPWVPGAVPQKAQILTPPDITVDYYRQKSDGFLYGVIHFGPVGVGRRMGAYGWKLSPREHWDIINYVRSVQVQKAKGSSAK